MDVFEVNVDDHSRILPIVLCCHSFLRFQFHGLVEQITHFLIIADSSILVTEFIEVTCNFYLCRTLFILTIGLIHFWDDFYFLLNYFNCFFTIQAPSLRSDVLKKGILTVFTFLRILRSDVDCVHKFAVERIIILRREIIKLHVIQIKSILTFVNFLSSFLNLSDTFSSLKFYSLIEVLNLISNNKKLSKILRALFYVKRTNLPKKTLFKKWIFYGWSWFFIKFKNISHN